ncbi:ABC transporter permease [Phaeobacter sp. PT47_59]|uniref:ABC transporter permease n=1 Tax=Phaeobacter sp. PT47_59 TaxID=3029979 RepID=UPI002380BD3F|nr:ABC transporter permease [Phaeobacter sp. PT47_59]MDE4175405.1 ABC transporter permease [Phaeobacter sp. PT47_59]
MAIAAATTSVIIGIIAGAIAGFYGGIVDIMIMRITEMFQIMPMFVLAALIVAMTGAGLTQVILVIALLSWPQVAHLMRGEVLRVRQMEFIQAAYVLGIRERFIILRQVIPNALTPVIALTTLMIGQAILLEASLGFLGLSNPEQMSWGKMLNNGQRFVSQAWWLSAFPGMAIFMTVLAFNLAGDAVGRMFDPRRSR